MRRLKILHVENNREDALLLARACTAADLPADFFEVRGGNDAVAYIQGVVPFTDRGKNPLPDLVILNLKLPGLNGFEFLRWLRCESGFRELPALVFTESRTREDKERAITAGASGYFVKPMEFGAVVRIAESFRELRRNSNELNCGNRCRVNTYLI